MFMSIHKDINLAQSGLCFEYTFTTSECQIVRLFRFLMIYTVILHEDIQSLYGFGNII